MIDWSGVLLRIHLGRFGLTKKIVEIIMTCVSYSSMQVLWNGEMSRVLKLTRGVRQGDTLSPYLSVLCTERLRHCIKWVVDEKMWKLIALNKGDHKFCIYSLHMTSSCFQKQVKSKWK